jgi:hypothetical protein
MFMMAIHNSNVAQFQSDLAATLTGACLDCLQTFKVDTDLISPYAVLMLRLSYLRGPSFIALGILDNGGSFLVIMRSLLLLQLQPVRQHAPFPMKTCTSE